MFRNALVSPVLLSSALLFGCGVAPEVEPAAPAAEAAQSPAPAPKVDPFAEDTKDNSDIKELYASGQASVAPVSNASATEWIFRGVSTTEVLPLYPNTALNLFDAHYGNYVKYGSRDYGINLVWGSAPTNNVRFLRAAGSGPLRFGDTIAVHIASGGYVKYGSRTWGINLVWSSSPVYEWQVEGGTVGQVVYTNQRVRLVNRTERSGMVYCRRPTGINLAWQDNCTEALGYRIVIDYLCSINPIC
jgi:hypothetical protein